MNQKTSSCDQSGKSFTRSTGLEKHGRICGAAAATTVAVPAAKKGCTDVAPERLQFKLQKSCEELEGNVQQFSVNI